LLQDEGPLRVSGRTNFAKHFKKIKDEECGWWGSGWWAVGQWKVKAEEFR